MPLTARDIVPALVLWPALQGSQVELVNYSENQTFRVDTVDRRCFMLRVHRMGYQSGSSIQSELDWLQALHHDTTLPLPHAVSGLDGHLLQNFVAGDGTPRLAVLFEFIAGSEPTPHSNLSELFGRLGDYAARLHQHAIAWRRPAGFQRQSWLARIFAFFSSTRPDAIRPSRIWSRVIPARDGVTDGLLAAARSRVVLMAARYTPIRAKMRGRSAPVQPLSISSQRLCISAALTSSMR